MRAMQLERIGQPRALLGVPVPQPGAGEARVKVSACG
ncbi:MAG TPA: alcohol dehydrogenase, partial [Pseudomonas sp.]|nr:alcohol dehydrogenase [Pseudomonas sp.]